MIAHVDLLLSQAEHDLVQARARYRAAPYGGREWIRAATAVVELETEINGLEGRRNRLLGRPAVWRAEEGEADV
jgi:hypothetical protein